MGVGWGLKILGVLLGEVWLILFASARLEKLAFWSKVPATLKFL